MGESFITRRGVNGLSLFGAVLHVNAPVGSTVEFKKGDLVVKTLKPEKGHPNSDGLYADYYLTVSTYNYGEWTATASLESMSISKTVVVDGAKQYDMTLRYELVLFKEGTGLMNGYMLDKKTGATVTVSSAYIYAQSPESGSFWISLKPTIPDIVKYGTLQIEANADQGWGTVYMGLTDDVSGSIKWVTRKSISSGRQVHTLDISQIASGDYYFQTYRDNGVGSCYYYDIRLLPRNEEA